MKKSTKPVVALNHRDAKYLADRLMSFARSELSSDAIAAFPPEQVMRLGMAACTARIPEYAKDCETDLRIWNILNEGVKLGKTIRVRYRLAAPLSKKLGAKAKKLGVTAAEHVRDLISKDLAGVAA